MRYLLCALALVLALMPPARAQELRLYTAQLPPFTMEDGGNPGLAVEIARAVAKRAGVALDINFRSWTRAQADVRHGRDLAIIPLARTPEREANYTWVGAIFDIEVNIVDAGGHGYTLDQARALGSVVVQDGTSFVSALKREGFSNLVARPDTFTNGRMLAGQRVDAWYVPRAEAIWVWKMAGLAGTPTIGPVVEKEVQWLAMSPDADPAIVERLRKAIAAVIADGTRDRIIRAYLE